MRGGGLCRRIETWRSSIVQVTRDGGIACWIFPAGRVCVDEVRFLRLRDYAVRHPDGTEVALPLDRTGTTIARVGDGRTGEACDVLDAWDRDAMLELPAVVIWPDSCPGVPDRVSGRIRRISVLDARGEIGAILVSEETISVWKVAGSAVVLTRGPRRKADHVIDLGDVLR